MNKLNVHPLIKLPLMLFLLVMVISIVIVAISNSYLEHTYDAQKSEKRSMRIWKSKIYTAKESDEVIDEYESRYKTLLKKNIVGEENRLNWLETIQAAANARGMSSVKYNVASQHLLVDKTGQHQAQGLKVYQSNMIVDMKMAHEGDLFAILNALEDKAQGLFTIDKCNIEKTEKALKNSENMSAHCELGWYTIKSVANEVKN